MLNSTKVGTFIMHKRRALGMTQQQLAEQLNVSFQAVSKWENGATFPNVEILCDLATILDVTVDEILSGSEKAEEGLSYSKAGVDIAYTDAMKKEMAKHLETTDRRVLNGLGPFASLYDIHFPNIQEPVLVLKSEEPGSKQKQINVLLDLPGQQHLISTHKKLQFQSPSSVLRPLHAVSNTAQCCFAACSNPPPLSDSSHDS